MIVSGQRSVDVTVVQSEHVRRNTVCVLFVFGIEKHPHNNFIRLIPHTPRSQWKLSGSWIYAHATICLDSHGVCCVGS